MIDSPAAAAEALRDYFLANADRGDNAANDELVAEMVRRIRTQHASGDGRPLMPTTTLASGGDG